MRDGYSTAANGILYVTDHANRTKVLVSAMHSFQYGIIASGCRLNNYPAMNMGDFCLDIWLSCIPDFLGCMQRSFLYFACGLLTRCNAFAYCNCFPSFHDESIFGHFHSSMTTSYCPWRTYFSRAELLRLCVIFVNRGFRDM